MRKYLIHSTLTGMLVCLISTSSQAGIPVADGTNLSQNIVQAIQSVAQVQKQIQQYQTQLRQYENEIRNTVAPSAYIWSNAQKTMNGLKNMQQSIDYYKQQYGSIDAYLKKYQDASYYSSSPCFKVGGCSDADTKTIIGSIDAGSTAEKKANDMNARSIKDQMQSMQTDTTRLQALQSRAQGAAGQMQAMGYANQMAAEQINQLIQLRKLLVAQQNAVAAKQVADANREAINTAFEKSLSQTVIKDTAKPLNIMAPLK